MGWSERTWAVRDCSELTFQINNLWVFKLLDFIKGTVHIIKGEKCEIFTVVSRLSGQNKRRKPKYSCRTALRVKHLYIQVHFLNLLLPDTDHTWTSDPSCRQEWWHRLYNLDPVFPQRMAVHPDGWGQGVREAQHQPDEHIWRRKQTKNVWT